MTSIKQLSNNTANKFLCSVIYFYV